MTLEEVTDTPKEVNSNIDQQPHIHGEITPGVVPISKNYEISLRSKNMWGRYKVVVDNEFAYTIFSYIKTRRLSPKL